MRYQRKNCEFFRIKYKKCSLPFFKCFPEALSHNFLELKITIMKIKKFLTIHASLRNAKWLERILKREGEKPGSRMLRDQHNSLGLEGR